MPRPFDAYDWYWKVGSDDTKVFSSKSTDYVLVSDPEYVAFLGDGNSPAVTDSQGTLAAYLATLSIRPSNASVLDAYRGSQASKLTLEIVAKVLFNHENRVRALENKPPVTANQFINVLKAML